LFQTLTSAAPTTRKEYVWV